MSDREPLIRSILVPHDFSDTAETAFRFALDLAESLGSSVTLLHAYEMLTYGFAPSAVVTVLSPEEIASAARAALDTLAGRGASRRVALRTVLRQGPAWSEICDAAKEERSGLVVMGTHGRRGVSRLLLGSVAEKVVRAAPCPVLTVRGTETAPRQPS